MKQALIESINLKKRFFKWAVSAVACDTKICFIRAAYAGAEAHCAAIKNFKKFFIEKQYEKRFCLFLNYIVTGRYP